MYLRAVRDTLYSYNYASARAFTLAVEHVMRGPEFWRENVDMIAVREELARSCSGEKMAPVEFPHDITPRKLGESRFHRLIRKVTLNGFLLPDGLIRNKTVLERKSYAGDSRRIFKHRRVLYVAPNGNTGYLAEYDKKRFWEEYRLARKTARELSKSFETLRTQYRQALPDLTSEKFWRDIYSE